MNIKQKELTKEEKKELVGLLLEDLEALTLAGASIKSLDKIDRMLRKLK